MVSGWLSRAARDYTVFGLYWAEALDPTQPSYSCPMHYSRKTNNNRNILKIRQEIIIFCDLAQKYLNSE
jgi:hypothetical protein